MGILVVCGCFLNIPSLANLLPAWIATKTNGAICYSLLGLVLYLRSFHENLQVQDLSTAPPQLNQELFRRAILEAPVPTMLHAENGEILQINHVWTELTGYSLQDLPTMVAWVEKAFGGQKDILKAQIDQLYSLNQRTFQGEYTVTTCNGDTRVWEFSSAPLGQLLDGRKLVISTAQDITERKQAERFLQESEERLRSVLDAAKLGSWYYDISTGKVLWSERCRLMFGLTAADGVYGTFEDCLHPAERDRVNQAVVNAIAHRQDYDIEYRIVRPDGTIRWLSAKGCAFYHQNGEASRMLGVASDITDRKQAEEALRQANETLELRIAQRTAELAREKELAQVTLQSIGDAVITTDALGRVQYLNPIAEALTGWQQSDAQGLPLIDVFQIIDEITRQPISSPVERALKDGCIVSLQNHTLLINREGHEYPIDDSAAPIRANNGQVLGAVLVFHDASQNRHLTQQLSWQASHDALTGLVNRREFEHRLDRAVTSAQAEDQIHALCYLDLDQFKIVNDTCGHTAGDELLRQVTALLQAHIRKSDTLARLGGDEFGVLLHQCPLENSRHIANLLREEVQNFRFHWKKKQFAIGVSIGLVVIDQDSGNMASVLSKADAACYAAKNRGRNRVHVYQVNDLEVAKQQGEMQWMVRLTEALEKDYFCLYYQPIVPAIDNLTRDFPSREYYEVLLRLRDEVGNLISPMAFIPAAERYGLMHLIDRWVIRTLFAMQAEHCREIWRHCREQRQSCNYLYSVNLSGASINDEQFIEFLKEQFVLYRIPPELICFEIPETVAIAHLSKTTQVVAEIRQLGCRCVLDKFGSGLSSFTHLKQLPVDYLKIDGTMIRHSVNDVVDTAIIEAIQQIGQAMGIQTIAEFVENDAILAKVKELGINYVQGYGIARPNPLNRGMGNGE
jgi:diguanylate cyclase (GGDEF)-like protein/PAS domain S-box-containing protein